MENVTFKVRGMTCGGCVASVQRVLRALDGVERADVSLEQETVSVEYEPRQVMPEAMQAAIEDAGYEVHR